MISKVIFVTSNIDSCARPEIKGERGGPYIQGAWELLKSPPSEPECRDALRHIPDEDLADERQRIDQHRQRFRFEMRSIKSADAQLGRLFKQWLTLPKS
jgi:hypothetical protein